jgi:hypothetical protein
LNLIRADAPRLQVVSIAITRDELADFSRNIAGHTFARRCFRARNATRLAVDHSANFVVVATTIALHVTTMITMTTMSTVSGVVTIKFDSGGGFSL